MVTIWMTVEYDLVCTILREGVKSGGNTVYYALCCYYQVLPSVLWWLYNTCMSIYDATGRHYHGVLTVDTIRGGGGQNKSIDGVGVGTLYTYTYGYLPWNRAENIEKFTAFRIEDAQIGINSIRNYTEGAKNEGFYTKITVLIPIGAFLNVSTPSCRKNGKIRTWTFRKFRIDRTIWEFRTVHSPERGTRTFPRGYIIESKTQY